MKKDDSPDIKYGIDSAASIKVLRRNKIETVHQFLTRPTEHLQKILKITAADILSKKKLLRGYNIPADYKSAGYDRGKTLAEYLDEASFKAEIFPTGIPQFNELLPSSGINSGDVIEICGRPATGKTMLIYTIILKTLESNENYEVFYIDTRNDFQPIKLKNMMNAQGLSEEVQSSILRRLLVKRVRSLDELNKLLKTILKSNFLFDKVKIIVLDSICSLAYLTMGDGGVYVRRMLTTTKLIKLLSGRNFAFLITNLALRLFTPGNPVLRTECSQPDSQKSDDEESLPVFNLRPALGTRWINVAHHKILVDFLDTPHNFSTDCTAIHRKLSLFYSKGARSGATKRIKITDSGVA